MLQKLSACQQPAFPSRTRNASSGRTGQIRKLARQGAPEIVLVVEALDLGQFDLGVPCRGLGRRAGEPPVRAGQTTTGRGGLPAGRCCCTRRGRATTSPCSGSHNLTASASPPSTTASYHRPIATSAPPGAVATATKCPGEKRSEFGAAPPQRSVRHPPEHAGQWRSRAARTSGRRSSLGASHRR